MKDRETLYTYWHGILTVLCVVALSPGFVVYAASTDAVVVRSALVQEYPDGPPVRTAFTTYDQEASLYLQPLNDTAQGATTTVRVSVDPGQGSINGVSLYLQYPTSTLALTSVNEAATAFAFSFIEYVDVSAGVIAIHYMQPYPGVSEYADVTDLVFHVVGSGTSSIYILPQSQVTANDGRGTNVLSSAEPLTLVID